MLNDDYVQPSDLSKLGYYEVYTEVWDIDELGTWSAKAIPLKFHQCNQEDLQKFYKVRGD